MRLKLVFKQRSRKIKKCFNQTLEVLSHGYEQAVVYDTISDLTVEISTNLQKPVRSNKLKREEEEEKKKKKKRNLGF